MTPQPYKRALWADIVFVVIPLLIFAAGLTWLILEG